MCPITIGTMLAVGGTVGTTATAAGGGLMAGMIGGSSMFAGMSTAALGMSAITTAISGAGMLIGQGQSKKAVMAGNKAQRERAFVQRRITSDALNEKYAALGDRQMQENRLHQQEMENRQRAYEDAMADVTTSAAEGGATGINIAAIRQSMDMEMGQGNVTLATNLRWRARQYQRTQSGYQSAADSQILAATPQYEAAPSMVGPLLGTAGVGLSSLGKFGGERWLSTLSAKKTAKTA